MIAPHISENVGSASFASSTLNVFLRSSVFLSPVSDGCFSPNAFNNAPPIMDMIFAIVKMMIANA